MKVEVLRNIDTIIRPNAIVPTNTPSISITRLASVMSRPDCFIGMHFFNPGPAMALVEPVRGLQTSDATHDTAQALPGLQRGNGKGGLGA